MPWQNRVVEREIAGGERKEQDSPAMCHYTHISATSTTISWPRMVVFNEPIPPNRGLSKEKWPRVLLSRHILATSARNLLSILIPIRIAISDSNVCTFIYVHGSPLRAPPRSSVAVKPALIPYSRNATLSGSSCAQLDKALRARLLAIPHSVVEPPDYRSNRRRAPPRNPLGTGATSRRGSPAR